MDLKNKHWLNYNMYCAEHWNRFIQPGECFGGGPTNKHSVARKERAKHRRMKKKA